MKGWWPQGALRVRAALWFAGTGVTLLLVGLMIALAAGVWTPNSRGVVVLVLAVGLPSAALAFAVAGYVAAARALHPLVAMTERARRLSSSSLRHRLPVSNAQDEIGRVAVVFNETLDRLEDSFAELRRFTADASHELRTPLTAIRAVGEVALRQADPQALRDAVGSILEEVARMNRLIDRLLLLAQADRDAAVVHLRPVSAREIMLAVADSLRVLAEEKAQSLELHEVADVTAEADEALLRLSLMNLLQNAIRYSPCGTTIRLRAGVSDDETVLEVADEGPGVPLVHQPKVFDRFYRIDKSRSRTDGGTGLGLAIVKWAAERMHGSVALQSEPGHGSVFRIRLPLARTPTRPDGDLAPPPGLGPPPELLSDPGVSAREPVDDTLARLKTSPTGLTWNEAQRRLKHFGLNETTAQRSPSLLKLIWHAANNPFNAILIVLGVVSLVTRDLRAAAVMAVMVTLSTSLRFWQERKSLVQAESLRKLVRNTATVVRAENEIIADRHPSALDPEASDILMDQLVPGDIVLLSAGDMVPGDLRLLDSRDLFVTQSMLTGEAMPVEKVAGLTRRNEEPPEAENGVSALDQPDLLFMGSSVISGAGKAVVLNTGQRTYFGATTQKLSDRRVHTAFDRGVNQVAWLLIFFMCALVPVVFFINGLSKGQWIDAFFFAIAVAVGLTPEMLPMIVNANLARGALAMSRHKAIVKQLNAIQNLGAMDILCTDKTGTLTQDHVAMISHIDLHGRSNPRVLEYAFLNSFFQTGLKNLLDRAIIERATAQGLRELPTSFWKVDEIPFDFGRRRMSVVLKQVSGVNLLICKGAVEEMLQICSQVEDAGHIVTLTDPLRERIKSLRDALNDDGLRVIAIGFKAIDLKSFSVEDESGLIFSGFVAFLDPPKDSAPEALRLLREQGVSVKILTGDSAAVACKICRDVGLEPRQVTSGSEIDALPDDLLGELAERAIVFAKVSPLQKSRIVKVLKERHHTVGFLGDGVNDATALREADVGISVDSGVDVAKEAADIILLEKSLLVLEHGVVEGRKTFGNAIKYIKMTASSNFGNVLSIVIASAALPFLPMLPIQLLVQNLLYDLSQIAIPFDRVDEEFVRRPRQWKPRSIATFMLCVGPISSLFDVATFLLLWFVFRANAPARQSLFQSGWFIEGLLTQTLIVHVIRTEKVPFIGSIASWPVIFLTIVVMICGAWLPFSPLAPALGFQALPLTYIPWLVSVLIVYCVLTQLIKRAYVRHFGGWL